MRLRARARDEARAPREQHGVADLEETRRRGERRGPLQRDASSPDVPRSASARRAAPRGAEAAGTGVLAALVRQGRVQAATLMSLEVPHAVWQEAPRARASSALGEQNGRQRRSARLGSPPARVPPPLGNQIRAGASHQAAGLRSDRAAGLVMALVRRLRGGLARRLRWGLARPPRDARRSRDGPVPSGDVRTGCVCQPRLCTRWRAASCAESMGWRSRRRRRRRRRR